MANVGRISGPLLRANLERNGIDIAVETDLLYIDVNNNRIGVNIGTPTEALDVVGTAKSTAVQTGLANIDNVSINDNGITTSTGDLNISAATIADTVNINSLAYTDNEIAGTLNGQNIRLNTLSGGSVIINQNLTIQDAGQLSPEMSYGSLTFVGDPASAEISTNVTDLDLVLTSNGLGSVVSNSNTTVNANLEVTGNLTVGGNIIIGDENTDNITIGAEFASNLVPDATATYDIGTSAKAWRDAYLGDLRITSNSLTTNATGTDINITPTGTANVVMNTTTSARLPVGSEGQRPTGLPSGGFLRWSTTENQFEGFDGTDWKILPFGQVLDRYRFTATASQTVFTGADDDGRTLQINPGSELVTKNGFVLEKVEEYTVTGSTVTLVNPANVDDDVNVYTFSDFSIADVVPQSTGGTFNSGITVTGNLTVTNNAAINNNLTVGGYPKFTSTGALKLPVGTIAERPSMVETGQVRYNTETMVFEGYNGTVWSSLTGVKDADLDTYIVAESGPGVDNDQLEFFVANTRELLVDASGLTLNQQLTVPNGGTGLTTVTTNGVVFGNGAGTLQVTAESNPGSNATTSYGILSTDVNNVPQWTDTIDGGTY